MNARQELLEQVLSIRGARPGGWARFFCGLPGERCGIFVSCRISEHLLDAGRFPGCRSRTVWSGCEKPERICARSHLARCRFPSSPTRSAPWWGLCTSKVGKTEAIDAGAWESWAPNSNRSPTGPARFSMRQESPKAASHLLLARWHAFRQRGLAASARPASPPRVRWRLHKACRSHFNQVLEAPRPYVVVGGMTGSAKTEVLHALRDQGEARA